MPLTLANLKTHVQHALGGTPSDQLSEVDIINQAGRHMFTHGWKFRDRPTTTIQIASNDSFVTLPGDMGEIISVRMEDGLNDSIQLTTYDHVLMVRNGDISTGAHYYATVVWPEPYADDDQQHPRLEIAPTPTAEDNITLAYRALWSELSADDDIAQVPPFAEALLIFHVRAFAQGYEEEGMAQRLIEVEMSPMFQRVAIQDGMIQNTYGAIRGGMVGRNREGGRLPFNAIQDPS
tara:strand:- start:437 stop:1141 length:705 start_codon:yes stop_codon:yes gene_type:complete